MTSDQSTAALASNVTLALAYGILVLAGLYARFSGSHPRTRMIRGFVTIGLLASLFRFLYFAIPDQVWGQSEVPSEPRVRFSGPWWTTWIQYIDYTLGNIGFFAQQGVILYFWMAAYNALRKREAVPNDKPDRLYWRIIIGYAILEGSLVVLYFFQPFYTVICIHSVFQSLVSFALAAVFVALFCRLRAALEPSETMALMARRGRRGSESGNSSLLATTFHSSSSVGGGGGGYGTAAGSASSSSSGRRGVSTTADADPAERERQRKMSKITTIAGVCTVANFFRGCIVGYQSILFFEGELAAPDVWWLIILLDYGFVEVFAFAAVLFILRKPSKPKPLAAVSGDVAGASPPTSLPSPSMSVRDGALGGRVLGQGAGVRQSQADRRLGLGRASEGRQPSGLSLAPTPANAYGIGSGSVASGRGLGLHAGASLLSQPLEDSESGDGYSSSAVVHPTSSRGRGATGSTLSVMSTPGHGTLLALPQGQEGDGGTYAAEAGLAGSLAIDRSYAAGSGSMTVPSSTDAVVGLMPRRGVTSRASSSSTMGGGVGGGTGSSAVSRGIADGLDELSHTGDDAVMAGFRDEYDDAASYSGSDIDVPVPLSGSASMWDTPLRVSAGRGQSDMRRGAQGGSRSGMEFEQEEEEDDDDGLEDTDWAGADYSLVLATPTASGAVLSPTSSAGGLSASGVHAGSAGSSADGMDSMAGYDAIGQGQRIVMEDHHSEPMDMPGHGAGSVGSRGLGGLVGSLAAQLDPVKESVESDTAFPDSVSNTLR